MPNPGGCPDPGIKTPSPAAPALQVDSLTLNQQGKLGIRITEFIFYPSTD